MLNSMCQVSFLTTFCITLELRQFKKLINEALELMTDAYNSPLNASMHQCWNIVNWILRNKLQWNFNRNLNIFIQDNVFENGVCEMAAILSWRECVKDIE